MKLRTVSALSIMGVAMSVTPIWVGAVGVPRNLSSDQQAAALTRLETKKGQVSRQALSPTVKGPLLVRYMDSAQLQHPTNRIQSGQAVSPDEIDQALQPTNP